MRANEVVLVLGEDGVFARFLEKQFRCAKIDVVVLTPESLRQLSVLSESCDQQRQCYIEVKPGMVLGLHRIAAVVVLDLAMITANHATAMTPMEQYVQSAWLAFWMHGLQQARCVMNGVHHAMLSPSYFSLPRVYAIMQRCGMKVPCWDFNSEGASLAEHASMFLTGLGAEANVEDVRPHGYFCLQRQEGVWIRVLCVLGRVYAMQFHGHERVTVAKDVQDKLVAVCQVMQLDYIECLLLSCRNQWIAYGLSGCPQWDVWRCAWAEVWLSMAEKMTACHVRVKGNKHQCSMGDLHLPHVY